MQAARSRARAESIAQLQELPAKDLLEHIAWDDFHSLAFYPADFTRFGAKLLAQLDAGTRKRLMDKMAARRGGMWKKVYERLTVP